MVVTQHVPPALRGIVVAGFMAAFMSTFATQLNWGASYLVADFYRRFLKKDGSDAHYVKISRLATVLLVIASAYVSAQLASIRSGWEFVLEVGAGTGGVYLLRWYWWRINAWSEISAMATALASSLVLRWWLPFSGNSPVVFAKTALATTAPERNWPCPDAQAPRPSTACGVSHFAPVGQCLRMARHAI